MNKPAADIGFRLVPILSDARPADPSLAIPTDINPLLEQIRALYERSGWREPWISYLSVNGDELLGGGSFVGAPHDGAAEVAYFTLPKHEGLGYAKRTALALVELANSAAPEIALWAKTLPEENASTRVLARLGFKQVGTVDDQEVGIAWRWCRPLQWASYTP